MTRSQAETAITTAGFAVGGVAEVWSENALAGVVIAQVPAAGKQAAAGSSISLTVSKGPMFTGAEQTIMLPGDVPMVLVQIPAGTFTMGRYSAEQDSQDWESPSHQVTIGGDFYLGKFEVTQAQWEALMGDRPSFFPYQADRPVESVSWIDAQEFITALNALGQGTFRLPSEAEWEYACRAGTATRFPWGDDEEYDQIGAYAWYGLNSATATHPVGQKAANPWGLYDMNGNVWEWCQDSWHDDYAGAPTDGSAWESDEIDGRVGRGGGWNSYNQYCRSAYRSWEFSVNSATNIGFRVAGQF